MQLIDLFAASLIGQSGDVAIEADEPGGGRTVLTFGELDARSNRLARLLVRRGLAEGDRLGVYLSNCVGFVDVVLACLKLGVILVPINVLYKEREIAHIVGDAEPRAVITSQDSIGLFAHLTAGWDLQQLNVDATEESSDEIKSAPDGDRPAAIVYTSGTTGQSKGAVLSHNNFLANTANLIACWRITAADRYLAVLPLFHVHGLANGLMTWLATGCRMRLVERFEVSRVADLFSEFQPTLFFGVPTIYVRLLELSTETARAVGAHMRLFVSGSAPLAPSVFQAFRERFGHTILERYGMSETLMNISNPYAGERRAGAVGRPLPGVSARILREDGGITPTNETGELYVRGPNVFSGYWRRPDATADAFVDGWFRTGDLAECSDDGYFTLRGRRTDLIISGGFNIYPREIEEVLTQMTDIREAVVLGVPDSRRGELPVAYVVADRPVDPIALDALCRRMLASFKVPKAFVQVDSLPRTALGKVQRHLLPKWSGRQE